MTLDRIKNERIGSSAAGKLIAAFQAVNHVIAITAKYSIGVIVTYEGV